MQEGNWREKKRQEGSRRDDRDSERGHFGRFARARSRFLQHRHDDLIQYTIAVDRVNERIAHLYEPTHPAVLRLLKMIADAAHANKIWVGVCGEMARDVALIPILLGLGIDELSVGATSVPRVKMAVRS